MEESNGALLPAERLQWVQDYVRQHRTARVTQLSQTLGVSEVTVRRDLELLERRGIVERTRGGAIAAQRIHGEPPYLEATSRMVAEKQAIGRAAAALVEPGDTIFLSGGTTPLEVFRHITAPGVRVISNNVALAVHAPPVEVELILLGGVLRRPLQLLSGEFALHMLRSVYAAKAFLATDGVSLRSGVTTTTPHEAMLLRTMIERTRGDVYVVADHTKFGVVADFVIAELDDVDHVVVDAGITADYRSGLQKLNVGVVVA
jgi:DeoR family transcriptional regulator, fructose operon transcriptional repressor